MIIRFSDLQVFDVLNDDDLVIQFDTSGRIVLARPGRDYMHHHQLQLEPPYERLCPEPHFTVYEIRGLSSNSLLRVRERGPGRLPDNIGS